MLLRYNILNILMFLQKIAYLNYVQVGYFFVHFFLILNQLTKLTESGILILDKGILRQQYCSCKKPLSGLNPGRGFLLHLFSDCQSELCIGQTGNYQ